MDSYENYQIMMANLKKKGFTVDEQRNIFKGTEYAGQWSYKLRPMPGKEAVTPVEVDMILKYR